MRQSIKMGFSNRLRDTSSRFGLVFFILATSNLFLGVVAMWPLIPELSMWAKLFLGLAIAGFLLAIYLSFYWLVKGSKDTSAEDIREIRKLLEEEQQQREMIQACLTILSWLLNKFSKGK